MKNIYKYLSPIVLVALLLPIMAIGATILFPSGGGTGWGTPGGIQAGNILIGNGLSPIATSSDLTFSSLLKKLTVTYASSTAISATTLCLTGDTCLTTWPTGGSGSDPFTHPSVGLSATTSQMLIGTSTASNYQLTIASSTASQLSLSAGAGLPQWAFRNAGGSLFLSTTTVAGTATTTTSALSIKSTGQIDIMRGGGTSTNQPFLNIGPGTGDTSHTIDIWQPNTGTQNVVSLNMNNNTQNNFLQFSPTGANTSTNVNWIIGTNANSNDFSWSMWNGSSVVQRITLLNSGELGLGTTTPSRIAQTTIATTTTPQLSLSAGAGINQIAFRNAGGNLYISSTTVAGTATTSTSLLEIASGGFGTTTLRGLNIVGQATSTSNVGFNITTGCFSINGGCIGGTGVAGLTSYDAWTHPSAGQSATTSLMLFNGNASTTGLSANYAAFGASATTTISAAGNVSLPATGTLTIPQLTSALTQTDGNGLFAEYGGTSCTNQFVRSLSVLGIATCATVGASDVSLANLTATDSTLTFSGAYTGATARTIGLNLANANTWTVNQTFNYSSSTAYSSFVTASSTTSLIGTLTATIMTAVTKFVGVISATFTPSTEGEMGVDTTSNQLKYYSNSAVRVLSPVRYSTFTYATSTSWTGTTTRAIGPAIVAETWLSVSCFTDTGTVQVSFSDATNRMNFINASTTDNLNTLTTNNTFTALEKRYVDLGTPASSPTSVSCTRAYTIDAD